MGRDLVIYLIPLMYGSFSNYVTYALFFTINFVDYGIHSLHHYYQIISTSVRAAPYCLLTIIDYQVINITYPLQLAHWQLNLFFSYFSFSLF